MTEKVQDKGRLLRREEVCKMTGLSKSGLYEKLNPKSPRYDPTFPSQVSLGPRSVAWYESEVLRWINARSSASQGATPERCGGHRAASQEDSGKRIPAEIVSEDVHHHRTGDGADGVYAVPVNPAENGIEKTSLDEKRAEIVRRILEEHAARGELLSYRKLMVPTMLSPDDPEDRKTLDRILEGISRTNHSEQKGLLGVLVHERPDWAAHSLPGDAFFELAKSLGYEWSHPWTFVKQQVLKLFDIYNPPKDGQHNVILVHCLGKRMLTRVPSPKHR